MCNDGNADFEFVAEGADAIFYLVVEVVGFLNSLICLPVLQSEGEVLFSRLFDVSLSHYLLPMFGNQMKEF